MFNLFKKPAMGLDISDYSIEVLELERKFGKAYSVRNYFTGTSKGIFLKTYGRIILEKGIVENGKILDKEKLKEKIKELLNNTVPQKMKTNQVILSLPESKTFIHIFRLPVANHAIIEEEAKKIIPWDFDKIYFDFQVISKKEQTSNVVQEILYAGATKEIVDDYLEVLKSTGLKPVVLDIESGSLAKAFETEMIQDGGTLLVDIGARTTNLTVFDNGSIRLSAIVSVAGNHFTRVISEKLNISLEKAEEFKKSCGLDPEKEGGKVMLALQDILRDILEGIKKTIGFYEEKSGRKIKKILLCGGSAFLPQLDSYISSNFGISVKIPDPWQGINVEELFKKPEFKEEIIETNLHSVFFANVIGLAKRSLEKNPKKDGINLLPKGR